MGGISGRGFRQESPLLRAPELLFQDLRIVWEQGDASTKEKARPIEGPSLIASSKLVGYEDSARQAWATASATAGTTAVFRA